MNKQKVQHGARNGLFSWRRGAILALAYCTILSLLNSRYEPTEAAGNPLVPNSAQKYIDQVEASYRDVKTLKAEFTQTYFAGDRSRVESGVVYFARGGRMRWEYRDPEEKLFMSDGKSILLYVPAEKQLTRSAVKSSEDARVPFRLLLSRLKLHRVFGSIEFADPSLKPQPGDEVLRALPKPEDAGSFQEVLFELTPAFDIRKLMIRYPDRSSMEFTFNAITRNVQLNPRLFRFSPPPGTEVIDQQ